MKPNRIGLIITGLAGGGYGMEILKALKMSKVPYYLVGTDITKSSYGLSLVDKSFIIPPAGHPEYIETLVDIAKKNNVRALFHGSEAELKVISKNRNAFKDIGVFLPINPAELIDICINKYEAMALLKRKGFNTPKTFLVKSLNDAETVDVFPVVCKPYIGGGGSNNVFIAQDKKELRLIFEYLSGYMTGFLVQEYIGSPDSEYTIGVLSDLEGAIIGSIGVKRYVLSTLGCRIKMKNKTTRKELGEILAISSGISQGEIGRFREITGYCETVARAIGAKGPINFQCRVFNNKVYIFEINPRFSGTTSLRAMAGFNEPDILIRKYILGEKIGKVSYREGVILRSLEEKFV